MEHPCGVAGFRSVAGRFECLQIEVAVYQAAADGETPVRLATSLLNQLAIHTRNAMTQAERMGFLHGPESVTGIRFQTRLAVFDAVLTDRQRSGTGDSRKDGANSQEAA